MKRRNFVKSSLLAGASGLFAGIGLAPAIGELLNTSERDVFKGLATLFPKILVQDVKTAGTREVQAAVSIDDLTAFLDDTRRSACLPKTPIKAEGQFLSFTQGETHYQIRLLLPADFDRQSGTALHC